MHRSLVCAALVAAACSSVPPGSIGPPERDESSSSSNVGLGVLTQPNNHVIRPAVRSRAPRVIHAGDLEVSLVEDPANSWGFNRGDYRSDFGSLTTMLALSYGIAAGTALSLEATDFTRVNSFLDGITEGFHGLFGISNGDRDDYPEQDNVIDLVEREDFDAVEDRYDGSVWRTLGLVLEREVSAGGPAMPALSVGCEVRYLDSTQGVLEPEDSWSAGVWTSAAKRLGRDFHAYLGVGYGWHEAIHWHTFALESDQGSVLAALEWRANPSSSWILQYLFTDDVTTERPPWDDPSFEVLAGWRGKLGPSTQLEIGLLENTFYFGTSPDFGVHLGLRQAF